MVGILIRLWHVLDYLLQISYDCMQYLYRYGFHYELKSMVWTTHDNKCMKHVYLCTVYVHIYAKNSGEFLLIWNVSCCYISGTFLALWSFVWICLLLPFTGPFHWMKKFIYALIIEENPLVQLMDGIFCIQGWIYISKLVSLLRICYLYK